MEKLVGLKDAPLGVLGGLALIAVVAWAHPPLQAGLPTNVRPMVPLFALSLTVLSAIGGLSKFSTYLRRRGAEKLDRERSRLLKVYRPLRLLFLERHLTTVRYIGAPRLKDRLRNALAALGGYRRPAAGVRRALAALGDRKEQINGEIEYGGDFPLHEIRALACSRSDFADAHLLDLVRRADLSRCEEYGRSFLTDDELALAVHIIAEHERLSRRTGS